jgi:hypothetical protein
MRVAQATFEDATLVTVDATIASLPAARYQPVITTLKAMGGREGPVVLADRVGQDALHLGGRQ